MPRRPLNNFLKWSATALTLLGAALVSAKTDPTLVDLIQSWDVRYLNVGCVIWLIWSVRIRDFGLIVVNGGLLLIYMLGTVRSFL
jgi:hypothetical protein